MDNTVKVDAEMIEKILTDLVMKAGLLRAYAARLDGPMAGRIGEIADQIAEDGVTMAEWLAPK